MGERGDLKGAFDKCRPMLKKFGDDMGEAARKGEKNIVKISKIVKIQLDMLGIAIKKERLYYEIGKDVAGMLFGDGVDTSKLDKYKKTLEDMEREKDKRKRAIARVSVSVDEVTKKK